ncbi:undecaprenyldiphospho-muramoylpentapeptide beta-N-acetylglucosaminyltransferase [Lacimicrobium alkaliphilum]|uniref:UDP-N-acetylglucosamine--N-acetylmuramyl-(pentapeptide) pyrophosphoryl-undecaprenol N-acetylglucosamine transferase n=1 Tax=Lacimicrobium alkaliphilum TaxID=1526571 RepID=A0ABQ1QZA1_9ALTE|nr:undecaprenyldiphospho-muramoylpentapeptide beta-N-acetylglucosaminyltransferase [Lacimicrobium alkaliphilum]GGD50929.1 UDP-N-acetylglucosamine--N-acetylmuramyl-(pentapeptide) pyrophosphoryl-undecaprenol N-acetylglucosamine transferase [Lacimicrobium alkaliphilum]
MTRTLMIMAGGTGGHIFPGLAVADYLRELGWQIHWLGTAARMEAELVPDAGYPISFLSVQGVRGNGLLRLLTAPLQILRAVWQARKVIQQNQPDLVLGMGGFASGPGGVAAWLSGVPLLIHEQNAVPGMTNKLLRYLARIVLTGFDGAFGVSDDDKYQWVGNPVRADFSDIVRRNLSEDDRVRVLVIGGSLGARALNQSLPAVLSSLQNLQVRHQCGKGNQTQVEQTYQSLMKGSEHWQVEEFITDMAGAFGWADLIICRAGALTVSEVALAGLPAIFVPLPHAVDDHQSKNAQVLVEAGAAILAPQDTLNDEEFRLRLQQLVNDQQSLQSMSAAARKVARPDATAQVAACCRFIVEQKL